MKQPPLLPESPATAGPPVEALAGEALAGAERASPEGSMIEPLATPSSSPAPPSTRLRVTLSLAGLKVAKELQSVQPLLALYLYHFAPSGAGLGSRMVTA